jgi:arylsulfatase
MHWFSRSLALLALAGCSDDATRPSPQRPNVILVCMDTVRADHVGWLGYERHDTTPHLDRLAEQAIVFEDASAAAGSTRPSVPTFMTGTYPLQHGLYGREGDTVAPLASESTTLAEVFSAAGWRTGAFVYNPQLARGNGFEQGFEVYDDAVGDAASICERAERWLADVPDDEPYFLYLHFLDAHWPYPIPERYATMFATAASIAPFQGADSWKTIMAIGAGERPTSEAELDALRSLYDGGIRHVDDRLGEFLARLDERGGRKNTVICVLADHGEEFMEHGRIGHGHGLWENLLRVPWLLYVPGEPPARVKVPVSLIDVFPTLLAAAGLKPPEEIEGVDRLKERAVGGAIFAEFKDEQRYQQSLRRGDRKIVRRFRRVQGTDPATPFKREEIPAMLKSGRPQSRVYELAGDPHELGSPHDASQAPLLEQAIEELTRDLMLRVRYRAGERRELGAEELDRLRQLGY